MISNYWNHIKFANPEAFYLLIVPLAMLIYYAFLFKKIFPALTLSSLKAFAGMGNGWKAYLKQFLFVFRVLAVCALIICLARPQSSLKEENISSEGIDIVIALDISGSMLARDFKPDRLEVSKQLSSDFISGRPNDRIGFVVFAGESFTQCPITTDHVVLRKLIGDVKEGLVADGTAIGMGLATSVNRLQDSKAKSKVIILLTDGVNNAGFIDPITSIDLAIQTSVRVYTIGVGTKGMAPFPFRTNNGVVYQNMEVEIDESLLNNIAASTGGLYFRATDNKSLQKIFDEIDTLEKSKIEVSSVQRLSEEFLPFALLAFICMCIETLLRYTILKSVL